MNNGDVFKALDFAVKNSNFKEKDLSDLLGSKNTAHYILDNANPNERYFRKYGSRDNETWVATLEAIALHESLKQSKINENSLMVARRTLLITMFFAAVSIVINLTGLKTDFGSAFIIVIALIIIGAIFTADWNYVRNAICGSKK